MDITQLIAAKQLGVSDEDLQQYPENSLNNALYKLFWQNKDKNFAQRVLYPESSPTLDMGNGNYATHLMMNAGNYIFPSVVQMPGNDFLSMLSPDEAMNYAKSSGEAMALPGDESADWVARNYKRLWR